MHPIINQCQSNAPKCIVIKGLWLAGWGKQSIAIFEQIINLGISHPKYLPTTPH